MPPSKKSAKSPESAADKKQIGLSSAGDLALKGLLAQGLFESETDAYKVSIAFALAKGIEPGPTPEGGYQTKFNAAGGLDVYGEIKDVICLLRPQDADRPYATAERLADLGVKEIAARIESHQSLAEILADCIQRDDE